MRRGDSMQSLSKLLTILVTTIFLLNYNSYAGKPSWVEKKNKDRKEEKEKWLEEKHEDKEHWKDRREVERKNWKDETDKEHERRREKGEKKHFDHKEYHGNHGNHTKTEKILKLENKIQKKELEIEDLKKKLQILKASEE